MYTEHLPSGSPVISEVENQVKTYQRDDLSLLSLRRMSDLEGTHDTRSPW